MSRPAVVNLRVREADSEDYDSLVVRIHQSDKPEEISFGDYVDISLDSKHWVTSRIEPSSLIGQGKIYIHYHLRGILNRDASRNRIAGIGNPTNFYIRRAPAWKSSFYILRYHPDERVRAQTRSKLVNSFLRTVAVVMECCLIAVFAISS
jgi:hypothetical protein